jgi:hypothetical protein
MDPSKYGPFANVVALAGALVTVFSVLLLKMLGGIKRWTWLASDSPPFLVTAGARIFAVALMAATYIAIDGSNYGWFGAAAVVSGILGFRSVVYFDRLRKLYVVPVPLVGPSGDQLLDKRGAQLFNNVVIGPEEELRPEAAAALKEARQRQGVSLRQFMSGYGSPVNDPESLWDRSCLASIANKLTTSLMYVTLLAVMTVFLAAFVIEVASKTHAP